MFSTINLRKMNGPSSVLALLVAAIGSWACEQEGVSRGGEGPSFTRYDSAGVSISITQGVVAREPLGWEVDSVPNLVVGAAGSRGPLLSRVQGVRGFSDGRVLVVDGGSADLRFFASDGSLVTRVGGRGKGPGEFLDPVLVPSPGADSLLLFDRGNVRLQWFSEAGGFGRVVSVLSHWPGGARPPLGISRGRLLLERTDIVGGVESLQKQGVRRLSTQYLWLDRATGEQTVLEQSVFDWHYQSGTWEASVPFASHPWAVMTVDGAFVTDGSTPEIRKYGVEGRLLQIFRLDQPLRPVTPEVVGNLPLDPDHGWNSRDIVESIPKPPTLPVFTSLLVDDTGWLWAEVYGSDPSAPEEWIVFDPEGRARGSVTTPSGCEMGGTASGVILGHIGRSFIVCVSEDSFGVPYLRRFALQRGSDGLDTSRDEGP